MLAVFPAGSKVTDARVTDPSSRLFGPVPAPVTEIAQTAFAELGLTGLVLARLGLGGRAGLGRPGPGRGAAP